LKSKSGFETLLIESLDSEMLKLTIKTRFGKQLP